MKTLLESMYFQYRKGDLSKLIAKQARTETAQKLKLRLNNTNTGKMGGGVAPDNNDKNLPLSAILPIN